MIFFHQSATVIRPGQTTLRDGTTVADWSDNDVIRTKVDQLNIQPIQQEETVSVDGDEVVTGWRLQTKPPRDIDLEASDRVELADGTVCAVVGEVARHTNPLVGRHHHTEAILERAAGISG